MCGYLCVCVCVCVCVLFFSLKNSLILFCSFSVQDPLQYSQCISNIATYVNDTSTGPKTTSHASLPEFANLCLPFTATHGTTQPGARPNFIWPNHIDPKYWLTKSTGPYCSSSYKWPGTDDLLIKGEIFHLKII